MAPLLNIIPTLASLEIGARIKGVRRRAIFSAVIGVSALIAFGFGLATFVIWLARFVGALDACLYIALGFLVLAGLVYIVMKIVDARAKRILRRRREANRALYLSAAMAIAPSGLNTKSLLAVAIPVVALAGFLLSVKLVGSDGDE